MHPPELTGSFAKLARAKEHIKSLQEAEHEYFGGSRETRPFEVDRLFDPTTNTYSFVGRVTRQPPVRVGAIIGDIAHNLRSALDYLVWELVRAHSGDPELLGRRYPEFPICMDEAKWEELRGRGGIVRGVSPEAAERLKRVQPFNASPAVLGDPPLQRLHELCNRDKHRSIAVASGAVRAIHDGITYVRTPLSSDVRLVPIRDVAEIVSAESFWGIPIEGHVFVQATIEPSGPDPVIDLEGRSVAGLAFEDRSSVNYAIRDMGIATEDILHDFASDWDSLARGS